MIGKEVTAQIGETTYTLTPTLNALKNINAQFGSLLGAVRRLQSQDFEAVCFIIAEGAGLLTKQREALEQEVFENDVITASDPASDYMVLLMNPTGEEGDEDDSGNV